jgi:hypothetical protein
MPDDVRLVQRIETWHRASVAVYVPSSHLEQYAWLCTQPHTYYVCDMVGRLLFGTCIAVTWIWGWRAVGAPWGWIVPPAVYSAFVFIEFGFAAYYGPVIWADSKAGAPQLCGCT